jgi:hypothetical protein
LNPRTWVPKASANHRINVHQALKFGTPVREALSFASQVSNFWRPSLSTFITDFPEMLLIFKAAKYPFEIAKRYHKLTKYPAVKTLHLYYIQLNSYLIFRITFYDGTKLDFAL